VQGLLTIFAVATSPPGRVGDDGAVIQRIARGEDPALAELYDRYAQVLYTLGMRILRSVQDSEDIVQEVFIQVWKKAESYDAKKGTVYTWLVTMMRNRAIDRLRSKGYKHAAQQIDTAAIVLFSDAPSSNPHSHTVRSEHQKLVVGTLKQLSADQQQVLALAYYEGFSQSEIAQKLNIPLGTVKSRMRHGLQSMRSKLKGKL
jgi:RNA polymerase sigma-70 factor, ECF subfamily